MPSRSLATERETICTTPVEDIITQTFVLLATARESKCLIWPEPRSPDHEEEGKKKSGRELRTFFFLLFFCNYMCPKKKENAAVSNVLW